MMRFDERASIRPTRDAKVFLHELKEDGLFERYVDAYAFCAAYALKKRLALDAIELRDRSELTEVGTLSRDVRLALEASLSTVAIDEPADARELLERFTRYAEAGVEELRPLWSGKGVGQIRRYVQKIVDGEAP